MDTSKEYILMCEKAEEIQKLKIPKFSFVIVVDSFGNRGSKCQGITTAGYNCYNRHHVFMLSNPYAGISKKSLTWLPRQDQLQEMVKEDFTTKESRLYAKISHFNNFLEIDDKEERYPLNEDLINKHPSMEQLWLAFVMKEKYQKIWNGKEWVKNV
jgi:frataxin-like iron-binding protein CyaY